MFSDPSIGSAIGAIIERSINFALKYDPATRAKLTELSGRSVRIDIQAPDVQLLLLIKESQISAYVLTEVHEKEEADVTLSGEAKDFLSLVGESPHSFGDSNINVSGKVNVLNQLKHIVSELDIDWEEPISEILGVLPAHFIASTIRKSFHWMAQQGKDVQKKLPEYLTEELKAIPSESELEQFYSAVDELNASAQRLEAKIKHLKKTTIPG